MPCCAPDFLNGTEGLAQGIAQALREGRADRVLDGVCSVSSNRQWAAVQARYREGTGGGALVADLGGAGLSGLLRPVFLRKKLCYDAPVSAQAAGDASAKRRPWLPSSNAVALAPAGSRISPGEDAFIKQAHRACAPAAGKLPPVAGGRRRPYGEPDRDAALRDHFNALLRLRSGLSGVAPAPLAPELAALVGREWRGGGGARAVAGPEAGGVARAGRPEAVQAAASTTPSASRSPASRAGDGKGRRLLNADEESIRPVQSPADVERAADLPRGDEPGCSLQGDEAPQEGHHPADDSQSPSSTAAINHAESETPIPQGDPASPEEPAAGQETAEETRSPEDSLQSFSEDPDHELQGTTESLQTLPQAPATRPVSRELGSLDETGTDVQHDACNDGAPGATQTSSSPDLPQGDTGNMYIGSTPSEADGTEQEQGGTTPPCEEVESETSGCRAGETPPCTWPGSNPLLSTAANPFARPADCALEYAKIAQSRVAAVFRAKRRFHQQHIAQAMAEDAQQQQRTPAFSSTMSGSSLSTPVLSSSRRSGTGPKARRRPHARTSSPFEADLILVHQNSPRPRRRKPRQHNHNQQQPSSKARPLAGGKGQAPVVPDPGSSACTSERRAASEASSCRASAHEDRAAAGAATGGDNSTPPADAGGRHADEHGDDETPSLATRPARSCCSADGQEPSADGNQTAPDGTSQAGRSDAQGECESSGRALSQDAASAPAPERILFHLGTNSARGMDPAATEFYINALGLYCLGSREVADPKVRARIRSFRRRVRYKDLTGAEQAVGFTAQHARLCSECQRVVFSGERALRLRTARAEKKRRSAMVNRFLDVFVELLQAAVAERASGRDGFEKCD
ncbi:hypothetical protein DIPPA_14405 [Diplonema papillatum]|nr:hypothetical protein DIPPA_14405 [Diplonema papillatum]